MSIWCCGCFDLGCVFLGIFVVVCGECFVVYLECYFC